jgi:hypothetical protein
MALNMVIHDFQKFQFWSIFWTYLFNSTYLLLFTVVLRNVNGSDSQPECRGTLGCLKEMSGVPPNFELLPFLLMLYYIRYCKIVISNQLGVVQNIFKDLRGAANQKKVEKRRSMGLM